MQNGTHRNSAEEEVLIYMSHLQIGTRGAGGRRLSRVHATFRCIGRAGWECHRCAREVSREFRGVRAAALPAVDVRRGPPPAPTATLGHP